MRKLYKTLLVITITILILISAYFGLKSYEESGICVETTKIMSNETNQTKIVLNIVEWINNNIKNVWPQVSSNDIITKEFYFLTCKFSEPWQIFLMKCGSCGEYAALYVKMMECANITSRNIKNYDRDHAWDESLIDGKWIHVDPGLNLFNNSSYYNDVWGVHFSSLYADYLNGTIEDVTNRYVKTGNLTIFVTDGTHPLSNAKVTVNTGFLDIINYTDSNGVYTFKLGIKNYTVIAESGFLIGRKVEGKADVKVNDSLIIELRLPDSITLLMSDMEDRSYWGVVETIMVGVSTICIELIIIKFLKSRKKRP